MTALQRFIAASGMTDLADGVAVVARWMMPAGLVLSGVMVSLGEALVSPPVALTLPFWGRVWGRSCWF